MRIAVLGTGVVGKTIGTKLVELGHEVRMGSRTPDNERASAWAKAMGPNASYGTHRDAAAFGEAVFNCTTGSASLEALEQAGRENLAGKILIDLANPLDFTQGMPPCLTVCNTDSLAERIQRAFPEARVVKALNTVNAGVMVDPSVVPGDHVLFVCGNDATSKVQVAVWLEQWFGWKRSNVIDLGDITAARATEMFIPLWIRLYGLLGTPHFNINVIGGRPGV